MRVKGNLEPQSVTVESCFGEVNMANVRLRTNIQQVTKIDPQTEQEITLYEYDEFILKVKNYDGLQHDIEENFNDWVATGRVLEINESASAVVEMKEALKILGVEFDEE